MLRRAHRKVLPVFILLSSAFHLLLLSHANLNLLPSPAEPDYFGQTLLNVRLANTENTATPSLSPSITPLPVIAERITKHASSVSKPPEMTDDSPSTELQADNVINRKNEVSKRGAGTDETHNQLLGELRTRLSRYLVYPPLARRRGWEGTVLLGMRVESDGHLHQLRIDRSSGYSVLDHSALNSLNRVGYLAEATAWLKGREMDMQLPVIYRLIDN